MITGVHFFFLQTSRRFKLQCVVTSILRKLLWVKAKGKNLKDLGVGVKIGFQLASKSRLRSTHTDL